MSPAAVGLELDENTQKSLDGLKFKISLIAFAFSIFTSVLLYSVNYWGFFKVATIYVEAAHNPILISDLKTVRTIFNQALTVFREVDLQILPTGQRIVYGGHAPGDLSVSIPVVAGYNGSVHTTVRMFYSAQALYLGVLAIGLFSLFAALVVERRLRQSIFKNLEQVAQQAHALASIQMARQVAHDIRSPLTALNVVFKALKLKDSEERNLLENAMTRMKTIAEDLLKESANEPASPPTQVEASVGLKQLLSNLVSEKGTELKSRNVKILFDPSAAPAVEVRRIHVSGLSRVLSNLINNSVEARAQTLSISAKAAAGGSATIFLSDDGMGISPTVIVQLGQAGFTTKSQGHGLGLSHAKQWVKSVAGSLDVTSEPGQGTRMTLGLGESCVFRQNGPI